MPKLPLNVVALRKVPHPLTCHGRISLRMVQEEPEELPGRAVGQELHRASAAGWHVSLHVHAHGAGNKVQALVLQVLEHGTGRLKLGVALGDQGLHLIGDQ